MQKLFLLLLVLVVSASVSHAQTAALKGNIIDTSEKKNLANSVVALLRKTDSVLVTFSRTDRSGNFTLSHFVPGKYIIMVTHPAYADYMDDVEINNENPADIGRIAMVLKSQLLQEVVVSHKLGAIRMKGDTVEYKVDSFHMKAGASVEDMLKNLPGITVDKNGKITAQGQSVQKVLVDGEEFFSDDPTIATRGLLSDAVDKVQVFDKKSDQATFTGIDDGEKIKTIDLKLKDDKKKGYFGKVEASSNGDKFWNNNLMFNAFKKKRKFSAFGIMSSTGKTGLDWDERSNYGGQDMNMEVGDDGSMYMYSNSGGDEFGGSRYWGEGFPKGWSGGLHYSNKWNEDRLHVNGNYKFNKLNTEAIGRTASQFITEDSIYYSRDSGYNFSSKERHRLDGVYELQIDSSSSLKITAGGANGKSTNYSTSYSEWMDENKEYVRITDQRNFSTGTNSSFNSTLNYRKRFKKPGRTLSVSMNQDYRKNNSTGSLYADNELFSGGTGTHKIVDQQKINDNINSAISGRVSYTEPLSKRMILEFNYGLNNSHRQSSRTSLEASDPASGKYDRIVDSLTNDYVFNVLTHNGGINFRYAKPKKLSYSIGMNVSEAGFMRKDIKGDSVNRYSFTNFYPQANLTWSVPGGGNLRFSYNGATQAPSIDQIQPVADNSDQSNIRLGNPDLKQAFRHSVNLGFNQYKIMTESGFWANISFSTTQNAFSTFTDLKSGQRISKPVNVNGNYNINGYLDYNRKINWVKGLSIGPAMNVSQNRNVNFVDSARNVNNNYNIGGGLSFYYNIEKILWLNLRPSIQYNHSRSSLRPDVITKYWSQSHDVDVSVTLPWKMEIGTDMSVNLRQKISASDRNNNVVRWNARVERKLLKGDVARVKFLAYDILNRNIGFDRDISSNLITERTYSTFRRYFMLSFVWNFSKNGKPQE